MVRSIYLFSCYEHRVKLIENAWFLTKLQKLSRLSWYFCHFFFVIVRLNYLHDDREPDVMCSLDDAIYQ